MTHPVAEHAPTHCRAWQARGRPRRWWRLSCRRSRAATRCPAAKCVRSLHVAFSCWRLCSLQTMSSVDEAHNALPAFFRHHTHQINEGMALASGSCQYSLHGLRCDCLQRRPTACCCDRHAMRPAVMRCRSASGASRVAFQQSAMLMGGEWHSSRQAVCAIAGRCWPPRHRTLRSTTWWSAWPRPRLAWPSCAPATPRACCPRFVPRRASTTSLLWVTQQRRPAS